MKGASLTPAERAAAVAKLSRLTGLAPTYIDHSDLRVEIMPFIRELRRDENIVVGRLDSRLTGPGKPAVSTEPEFDPSMSAIRPPYTAAFNQYVRAELGYVSADTEYFILGGGTGKWDWQTENRYANVSEPLRLAFAKNPHMKLYVGSGDYDLATPYFAATYTLNHCRPSARRPRQRPGPTITKAATCITSTSIPCKP